jgi:hypothetical protein
MHRLIVLALALGPIGGCGGDDGGGGGFPDASGGGNATCTVTATATPDTTARTITGLGMVHCTAAATLALEVCVQWNASGSFADIMCQSSTMSGVADSQLMNVSSCGIGTGRKYRARVNLSVNGAAQPEKLSTEVGCE